MAVDGKVSGVLGIADGVKKGVKRMVEELRRRRIDVRMVTGDNERAAEYISKKAGIKDFVAQATPIEKKEIIKRIKSKGYKVMMVGDGINDAPSLVEADLGVTFDRAVDIALENADVVIINPDINSIIKLLDLAKGVGSVIKQNLFWAFSYNLIAIPFAVSGLLHPIISAMLMATSSLAVVGNSLRLGYKKIG